MTQSQNTGHSAALAFAWVLLLACAGGSIATAAEASKRPDGAQTWAKFCSSCHDQVAPRIPPREALTRLSPQRIMRTLDFGLMMSVAYPMRREEREAVAAYIGKGRDDIAPPASAMCGPGTRIMSSASKAAWTGWGPSPDNARFQDAASAGLDGSRIGNLKLKWSFGFPGDVIAFAAPTVLRGTMFVGSAGGMVQALDARTGCIHWSYQSGGPVRNPPTITQDAGRTLLLFTDQVGGVYALDAASGRQQWKTRVESHEATRLTGAIAVHDGLAFVPAASWEESRAVDPAYPCCTFRGSLSALNVHDGKVAWKTWMVPEPKQTHVTAAGTKRYGPSGVGLWSAPAIDAARGLVYVGTGNDYTHPATPLSDAVVAIQMKTGRIAWSRQISPKDVFNAQCARGGDKDCGPDHDFAAPILFIRAPGGRELLIAGQKSGVVSALDPADQGKVLWQTRVGVGSSSGGVQWGMASDGARVYAAVADAVRNGGDQGSLQIGNANFDPVKGGGLTALDVLTGAKVWFAPSTPCAPPREGCSPAQPGAVSVIPGAVISGSMDGHLRAFATSDGRKLWDVDTQQRYTTLNGVEAQGGSLDGAGAVVVDGMLYITSGYPRLGGAPGNVLLAFGLDSSRP